MSEMVDRIALELTRRTAEHYGDPMPANPDLSLTRLLAHAALVVLREPTEAMELAGSTERPGQLLTPGLIWRAMIDECLT